jgi:hypothetical protein
MGKMVWRPVVKLAGSAADGIAGLGPVALQVFFYGGQRGPVAVRPRVVAFRSPRHRVHEVKGNRPADHDSAAEDTQSPHSQTAALAGRRNCSRSPPCPNALLDGQRHGSQHI